MSEETTNIITNDKHKIKNPGRVAWGKKLAKMSKELKDSKFNNKKEIKLIKKDIAIDKETESKLNLHHIEVMIGIGGLLVAVYTLYLQYKNNKIPVNNNNQTPVISNNQVPVINNNQCPYNYRDF